MAPPPRSEWAHFRELTRLFFARFLENDLISLDQDVKPALVNILALVAAPGILIPLFSMYKYAGPSAGGMYERHLISIGEKAFFVAFTMTVVGIVTVLESDALFPDRRDSLVLRPFPIRMATMFAAKICALGGFWSLFTLAANAASSILFPIIVSQSSTASGDLFGFMWAHSAAMAASSAFVFFALVAAQGALMCIAGARLFRRLWPYLQFLLICALLVMFFMSGASIGNLHPGAALSPAIQLFPPAWFLGLYQNMLGWQQPVFRELAGIARTALALCVIAAAVAYTTGYARQIRRSLESTDEPAHANGLVARILIRLADSVVVRSAGQRAAFHFVWQTLFRSRRHRVLIAAYVATGFALVVESLAPLLLRGNYAAWRGPSIILLPWPHVLSFFLLLGVRYAFTIPAELNANWLFRVSVNGWKDYMAGVYKAVLLIGVAPLHLMLLAIYAVIWPFHLAFLHVSFAALLAVVWVDILLAGFEKLPFTCSYQAGKANLKVMWPIYAAGFVAYISAVTQFENWALAEPARLLWSVPFAAGLEALLHIYRGRIFISHFEFVFEDRPEPAVQTLNLSPR